MRALTFDRFGGPEVLVPSDLPRPELRPGTALVRTHAIGLNFADVYRRRGTYPVDGEPPYILGYEAAGVIEAIREDDANAVDGPPLAVGDRVGFADVPRANADIVRAPLAHLVPLPDSISFETGAALLLQGLTAHYLVNDSHPLVAGELAVVHAAAGGVGLLLVQLAKQRGANVLALCSTDAKAEAAKKAGADWVSTSDGSGANDDWVAAAKEHSVENRGADVVYDSVGSTLEKSFAAVRAGGRVVFYGMAGGDPRPIDPRMLMDGSKSITGGDLWNVLTSRAERVRRSAELFDMVDGGALKVTIAQTFPLMRGAEAHAFLESRQSIGKVLLLP